MSDTRTQGRKANDAGQAADGTVREHLATHAGLHPSDAKTLKEYLSVTVGGLYGGRGDFAEDVFVSADGAFARPFMARYAVRRRDWPHPLLLFVHSQNDSGTAENAVLRFLWNLSNYKRVPGIILLLGNHWEQPAAADAVAWVRGRSHKACPTLTRVFLGLAEFRAWIAEGMPWPESRQQSFA